MQEMKEALQRIEAFEQVAIKDLKAEIKMMAESITSLSNNIREQNHLLQSHKQLYAVQIEQLYDKLSYIENKTIENKTSIETLKTQIDLNKEELTLAKGAIKLLPAIYALVTSGVGVLVWLFTKT